MKSAKRIEWDDYIEVMEKLRAAQKWRDLILWMIGGHTAFRVSEYLTVRWNDILNTDTLILKTAKTARFGAKKASRKVWLSERAIKIIEECRDHLCPGGQTHTRVFRSHHHSESGTITRMTVNNRLKRIGLKYDLPRAKGLSSHSMRKTFAWRVYQNMGADHYALEIVRDALNHGNTSVTMAYLGLDEDLKMHIYKSL